MHSNDYNITKHGNFFFAKAHDRTKVILKLLLRANLLLAQRTIDLIFGNLCLVALYTAADAAVGRTSSLAQSREFLRINSFEQLSVAKCLTFAAYAQCRACAESDDVISHFCVRRNHFVV